MAAPEASSPATFAPVREGRQGLGVVGELSLQVRQCGLGVVELGLSGQGVPVGLPEVRGRVLQGRLKGGDLRLLGFDLGQPTPCRVRHTCPRRHRST